MQVAAEVIYFSAHIVGNIDGPLRLHTSAHIVGNIDEPSQAAKQTMNHERQSCKTYRNL
jgi:hypothetical protein